MPVPNREYYDLGQALASYIENIPTSPLPEEYREWWRKAARVFECLDHLVSLDSSAVLIQIENNLDLKTFLTQQHSIATLLSLGDVDYRISRVVGPGRKADRLQLMLIAVANLYIAMSKDDQINDPYPMKTIQDAYGVDRTTAQGWGRPNMSDAAIVARGFSPFQVINLMKVSGLDYRRLQLSRQKKSQSNAD